MLQLIEKVVDELSNGRLRFAPLYLDRIPRRPNMRGFGLSLLAMDLEKKLK